MKLSAPISGDLYTYIFQKFENKGGAYKLFSSNREQRISIGRFVGIDDEGILYIGSADKFVERVITLKKVLDPDFKDTNHSGARRYHSTPIIAANYPFSSLNVEFYPDENPELKEKMLLQEYFCKFGEVPPLNHNLPGSSTI